MKIRSKFKDYYDYVGHLYGEDPDVVYLRGKVPEAGRLEYHEGAHRVKAPFPQLGREENDWTSYALEYIIAGEMVFPIVEVRRRADDLESNPLPMYDVSYRQLDHELFTWMRNDQYANWSEREWKRVQETYASESFKQKCRDVLVRTRSPVVKIVAIGGSAYVDINTPVLSDHGIAAIVPPEAMWQNIYVTFTNVLRPNPDKAPPVEISDKDKISKAGFDLKTSFRNPINQRPKKK